MALFNKLYKKLGTKPFGLKEKQVLTLSIEKNYNVNDVSNFSSLLTLFTLNNLSTKTFNNKYQVVKLIRRKRNIHANGGIYKVRIKCKNKSYYKDLFVKECPVLPLSITDFESILYFNSIN